MYAVVTGASSGLGEAIADYLRNSFKVIAVGRKHPTIKVDEFLFADLSKLSSIEKTAAAMKRRSISVLVNNAGAMLNIKDTESLNLHLMAPKILMDAMENQKRARIINIASVSGLKGEADFPIYAACKAGLIALTKSYAKKFAYNKILVNAISPGFFKTNLFPDPTPEEMIKENTLLGYEALPAQIIPAIDMLICSRYTTGTNIVVDGGALLC
jgi:NAD(P)-dependent dehydrogenase (short-subunit alcohol dehydrogenase family)